MYLLHCIYKLEAISKCLESYKLYKYESLRMSFPRRKITLIFEIKIGYTETWTRIAGSKGQSANH